MLLRIFWSLCLWWGISSSALAEIHLKDVDGREVTLAAPAQRVYIGFYYEDFWRSMGQTVINMSWPSLKVIGAYGPANGRAIRQPYGV